MGPGCQSRWLTAWLRLEGKGSWAQSPITQEPQEEGLHQPWGSNMINGSSGALHGNLLADVIAHLTITCIAFSILLCAERKTEAPVRAEDRIKRAAQTDFPIQTKAESSSQKLLHSTPLCWNIKCLNEIHTWPCLIPLWCWRQRLFDGSQEAVHPKWQSAWKCTVDKSSFSQNFRTKT